jgi:ribosomal protein L7/L12
MFNLPRLIMIAVAGAKKENDRIFVENTISDLAGLRGEGIAVITRSELTRLETRSDKLYDIEDSKATEADLNATIAMLRKENDDLRASLNTERAVNFAEKNQLGENEVIVKVTPIADNLIAAIKSLRVLTGGGLKECKNLTDQYRNDGRAIIVKATKESFATAIDQTMKDFGGNKLVNIQEVFIERKP